MGEFKGFGRKNGLEAEKWNKEDNYANSKPSEKKAGEGEAATLKNHCWRDQSP